MRKNTIFIVGVSLAFFFGAASATWAGSGNGTINNVAVNTGIVFFNISGAHANSPSCATSQRFVFTAGNANGQAMLSVLLTAYGLGKTIVVTGTGACDIYSDSETVSYITSP